MLLRRMIVFRTLNFSIWCMLTNRWQALDNTVIHFTLSLSFICHNVPKFKYVYSIFDWYTHNAHTHTPIRIRFEQNFSLDSLYSCHVECVPKWIFLYHDFISNLIDFVFCVLYETNSIHFHSTMHIHAIWHHIESIAMCLQLSISNDNNEMLKMLFIAAKILFSICLVL